MKALATTKGFFSARQPLKRVHAAALLLASLLVASCSSGPSIRDAGESVSMVVEVSGIITAIDTADRMITLRDEEGTEVVVHADERVRNFPQLALGDVLTLMYSRSVAYDLQPAGSGEAGVYVQEGGARTAEGQEPGGIVGETVTVLAPIVAINRGDNTVSVRGPRGNVQVIHVVKPEYQRQLRRLNVGDMLRITYTEAMAISISPSN